MIKGLCAGRLLAITVVALSLAFGLTPQASAAIIGLANATSCNGSPPGGTICSNGSGGLEGSGGNPFTLTGLESGSTVLQSVIGSQTSPVYEIVNNTGSTVTTITLTFTGSLASNQFLNCQTNGGFAQASCTVTPAPSGAAGCSSGDSNPSNTNNNPCDPVTVTFSGLNIAPGQTFDLTFASFGNGDTGSVTGTGVPEFSRILTLLLTGLVGLSLFGFLQKRLGGKEGLRNFASVTRPNP